MCGYTRTGTPKMFLKASNIFLGITREKVDKLPLLTLYKNGRIVQYKGGIVIKSKFIE